ncbi:pyridoxal phosphate-dependent decarboxylase family protein [Nocardia farcinica]|uniref:pyridoxal phosphate-dependent decarboxylase family protein n=1 Tax=Nocardia farcinica TaxID=37329 RepID=UPI000C00A0D2|nr:pyridoxal-dependent decarboxylase [Nocardia farcinica]PFX03061.1 L-2,4-diaminobutyrate decarboxylase [Nocardia farcinica]PFX07946.1 L-2,4-diaminobutyrate decarboxylase [Nocardia farcinica]
MLEPTSLLPLPGSEPAGTDARAGGAGNDDGYIRPEHPQPGSARDATGTDVLELLHRALDLGLAFKGRDDIYGNRMPPTEIRDLLLTELPEVPMRYEEVYRQFRDQVLPLCKNEASPRFLGFGDTGDDPAALMGGVLSLLTQQNMINQSFDSPSATFIEITVLRWLRDLLGFTNPPVPEVISVWDVGGVIGPGGTMSNTIAMMLARETAAPGTMSSGVTDPERLSVVVPEGIGHYSVKAALTWIGCGARIIAVPTIGFRYDLAALERTLSERLGQVMAVVAYAGDSRTQTVDDLRAVHGLVRSIDPRIWLHADACWGLLAAFSPRLRPLLDGIAEFDSVTVDPHKIMAVPYGLSALLVRDAGALRAVSTYSDLIMQEDFAFGQVTPFLGTKDWSSLKLWMMMLGRGRSGLAALAAERVAAARCFAALVDAHPRLVRLNDPDLAAVVFVYLPGGVDKSFPLSEADIAAVNAFNLAIHQRMLDEGRWHLHQFTLPDDLGRLRPGAILRPLRLMANNPHLTTEHMRDVVLYLDHLATDLDGAV